jgi:aryl-alcohol dehydrogenase-like predicted oxidoreductase
MKTVKLGNSGLSVSEIGFGCMSLSKSSSNNTELITKAYENGINLFDTADRYDHGWNESLLGEAVKEFRNKVILVTKVGHRLAGDNSEWKWAPTKNHILSSVDQSLKRLQTDWIDLYQLHGGTLEDPIDEIIEAFEILKESGKIRSYGISSIRPIVIREYISRSSISCVMMQYSLLDRRPEEECLQLLKENNIGVLARGTLAKGVLVNKPATEVLGYSADEVKLLKDHLQKEGDPVANSIHFVLKNPAISSAVVGIRTEAQLDDIIRAYKEKTDIEKLEQLQQILNPNKYDLHR